MMLKKSMPLILLLFTIMCVLPAATTAVIPSAIAQEDDDMSLDEAVNLASGTVSNVLDNGSTSGDNANTQVSAPLTDQDQTDVNLGLSEALDVTVERTLSAQEEEPPEFVAFCLQASGFLGEIPVCFNTSEECERAEEILLEVGIDIISDCKGVETLPADAINCSIEEGVTIDCTNEEDM